MTYQTDLDQYAQGRGYPEADDNILQLIESHYEGGSFLILNSGTGLFGQRLIDRQGVTVIGIEADTHRINAGMQAGVRMQSHSFELGMASMIYFKRLLEMYGTTGLIMRNVVNTLRLTSIDWPEFMGIIDASNVFELFIEDGDIATACEVMYPDFNTIDKWSPETAYLKRPC